MCKVFIYLMQAASGDGESALRKSVAAPFTHHLNQAKPLLHHGAHATLLKSIYSFVAASEALAVATDKSVQQVGSILTALCTRPVSHTPISQAAQASIMSFRYSVVPLNDMICMLQ